MSRRESDYIPFIQAVELCINDSYDYPTCKSCVFSDGDDSFTKGTKALVCKRHAPKKSICDEDGDTTFRVLVPDDHQCGEGMFSFEMLTKDLK